LAYSTRALEQLLTTDVKIVLYPNNREKNTNSLRFFELKHVFVNHGESDKSVNQSKMLRSYDHIFVSGMHAIRRMESAGFRFLDDQIKVVGRPQIELNYAQSVKIANERKDKLIIAYAPTWEGGGAKTAYSSIGDFGVKLLKTLSGCHNVHVIFKPHPLTGTSSADAKLALKKMQSLCRLYGYEVVDAGVSFYDAFVKCDILISDIGAVLSEFLATEKPIIATNPNELTDSEFIEQFPVASAAYILTQPEQVATILTEIKEYDVLSGERVKVRKAVLGPINGLEVFKAELMRLGAQVKS
jgi:CDP-glycerol glycerophosphotransferase (TagB/SpsB family)